MKKNIGVRGEYTRLNAALIAVFIVAVAILNVIVYALSEKYEWYLYEAASYSHEIGIASENAFADKEQKDVKIIFCMEEDELSSDIVYDLVWQTACQLAEKYDFISVETVNIYLQPSKVSPYKYTTLEDGTEVRNAINTMSVIFVCGDEYRVDALSSFFVLDGQGYINSYNGEEYMLACIKWVQTEEHPTVYFTSTHGENFTGLLGFYNILTACGYNVQSLDLAVDEIRDDAAMIVISNPIYDIERASADSGIISEAERLSEFLSRGGTLFVTIDPYIKSPLTQLRAFLSEWGMDTNPSIITDTENSITYDGYTLVASYADGELGKKIGDEVYTYNQSQTILRDASPINLTEKEGIKTEAILKSYPSAKSYYGGELYADGGNFTLLAMAEKSNGNEGRVILSSGAYLLANDVLNSKVYSNRELIFALLDHSGAEYALIGSDVLPISSNMLEGLTTGASRIYAVVLVGIVPLLVAALGTVYIVRRRNR